MCMLGATNVKPVLEYVQARDQCVEVLSATGVVWQGAWIS